MPVFTGTAGANTLNGSSEADSINGRGGDLLFGGGGNDGIRGAGGDDEIHAGSGDDFVVGGRGDERLWGDLGADFVDAGGGNDVVQGGAGRDRLFGFYGNDTIFGDAGSDQISGESGTDLVYGGAGVDAFSAYVLELDFLRPPAPDQSFPNIEYFMDFVRGEDVIEVSYFDRATEDFVFLPFAAFDSNGDGVLTGRDRGVVVREVTVEGVTAELTVINPLLAVGAPFRSGDQIVVFDVVGLDATDIPGRF